MEGGKGSRGRVGGLRRGGACEASVQVVFASADRCGEGTGLVFRKGTPWKKWSGLESSGDQA